MLPEELADSVLKVSHHDHQTLDALLTQAINQTLKNGDPIDFGEALGLILR